MIYLVTGSPGAGKSLYAVSKLVQELAAQKIEIEGKETSRRIVVDNIPNLLLDHELMAPGKLVQGQVEPTEEGDGLWNWHKWCKPGDVIVVDEVQRHWRPRGAGTKVKEEVAMLETHRHLGVDFVIITQSPMLLDQNVRRLVGRHQHVRRLFGMARAVIYDWDSCSSNCNPASSTAKTYFNYPKSAYALYKSSELHTKQKQRIPLFVIVPILALVGIIFVGPKAFAVLTNSASGKGISSTPAKPPASPASAPAPALPASAPATPPVVLDPLKMSETPTVATAPAGCVMMAERCSCFDSVGKSFKVEPSFCTDKMHNDRPMATLPDHWEKPEKRELTPDQLDAYRFAFLK